MKCQKMNVIILTNFIKAANSHVTVIKISDPYHIEYSYDENGRNAYMCYALLENDSLYKCKEIPKGYNALVSYIAKSNAPITGLEHIIVHNNCEVAPRRVLKTPRLSWDYPRPTFAKSLRLFATRS